jgi:hypothetical protein
MEGPTMGTQIIINQRNRVLIQRKDSTRLEAYKKGCSEQRLIATKEKLFPAKTIIVN